MENSSNIVKVIKQVIQGREVLITIIFFLLCFVLQTVVFHNSLKLIYEIQIENNRIADIKVINWIWHIFVSLILSGLSSLLFFAFLEIFSRFPTKWQEFQQNSLSPFSTALKTSLDSQTSWCFFSYTLSQIDNKGSFVFTDKKVDEYVDLIFHILGR